jgi:hypothetical protein
MLQPPEGSQDRPADVPSGPRGGSRRAGLRSAGQLGMPGDLRTEGDQRRRAGHPAEEEVIGDLPGLSGWLAEHGKAVVGAEPPGLGAGAAAPPAEGLVTGCSRAATGRRLALTWRRPPRPRQCFAAQPRPSQSSLGPGRPDLAGRAHRIRAWSFPTTPAWPTWPPPTRGPRSSCSAPCRPRNGGRQPTRATRRCGPVARVTGATGSDP